MVFEFVIVANVCGRLALHADEHLLHFFYSLHARHKLSFPDKLRLQKQQSNDAERRDEASDLPYGIERFDEWWWHFYSRNSALKICPSRPRAVSAARAVPSGSAK